MDDFANFEAQFEKTVEKAVGGYEKRDPNQFKPNVSEKIPEYNATLRFIPPTEGVMFVKKVVHFMKIGKDTVRVICPKTHGEHHRCDICSDNIQGHKSKIPALIQRAKDQGNKVRWVANVLVLEDNRNPENVGKVMWWEFPDSIMTMINALRNPPSTRIASINPFNPIAGADLLFSMKLIKGFPKYEGTAFITQGGPTAISDDMDYIRQVRAQCHPLEPHQIVTPAEEARSILEKANASSSNIVDKQVYSNLPSEGFGGPSVAGFGGNSRQAAPRDEFDAAFETAGLGNVAPAAVAPRQDKPQMSVPAPRVAPVPEAPAPAIPHSDEKKATDDWLNDV